MQQHYATDNRRLNADHCLFPLGKKWIRVGSLDRRARDAFEIATFFVKSIPKKPTTIETNINVCKVKSVRRSEH